ncbi:MAG: T9SS type A sorting domain-containing protein [Draconibacterium sp.]|nr:T9SS type A sorting domain-containing protein [Draconibacterium sp.]
MWNAADCAGNTLSIQNISPGVYLLKAETDAGIKTEKLVVH